MARPEGGGWGVSAGRSLSPIELHICMCPSIGDRLLESPPVTSTDIAPPVPDALRWEQIAKELRARDFDPQYADAPVYDAYARISFNPHTGETEKTDRQLVDVLMQLRARDCRLGAVLRDDSKSAWRVDVKRDGWDTLLQRAGRGDASGLMCWHTDRLTRQPYDLEQLVRLAMGREYVIASCYGEFQLHDPNALSMLRFGVIMAENQSAAMSRRMKRGWQAKRELGLPHGGQRGFGFPSARGAKNPVPSEQVDIERAAIKWAVEERINGATNQEIVDEWTRRGFYGANGQPIATSTVRDVLTSDRIAGVLTYYGTPVGRDVANDPIITPEQLTKVRSTYQARMSGPAARYLAGGLLYCGRCSSRMSGVQFKGTKRFYRDGEQRFSYRCSSNTGCGKNEIDGRTVDAWLRQEVIDTLTDPAHARMIAKRSTALADLDEKIAAAESMLDALARQLAPRAKLGSRVTDVNSALAAVERVSAAMRPWEEERDKLNGQRDALLGEGSARRVERVMGRQEISTDWDSDEMTLPERRRLVVEAMPFGAVVMPAAREPGKPYPPALSRLGVLATAGERPPLGRI